MGQRLRRAVVTVVKKELAVLLGVLLASLSLGCMFPGPPESEDEIYVDTLKADWDPDSKEVVISCRLGNNADYNISLSFEAWVNWPGGERRFYDDFLVVANTVNYEGGPVYRFELNVNVDTLDTLTYGFDWGGTYRNSVNRTISPRLG
jgi:hypothetical protein